MKAEGTVHIADDDVAVLHALQRLLRYAGYETVAYESASAVLEAAATGLSAGCLLVDVRMPGVGGLELQARLNDLGTRLPVIMMTGQADVSTAVSAMKAGAFDFIEKPLDEARLLRAIRMALAGAGRVAREREIAEAATLVDTLSPRERQVLDALMAGRSNKVIAYDLNISERTVETHRARMLERLGTHSLGETIRIAVMASLASADGRDATRA
jgi:two-component system response regulator FixJ